MKRRSLILVGAVVVLLIASAIGIQPVAQQAPATDLQMAVGGVDSQAVAYFRLDKTCERGNSRCR